MRKITFISSILIVIYLYLQINKSYFTIVYDKENYLYLYFLKYIPVSIISVIIISLMLSLILSLIYNNKWLTIINYFFAIILLKIAIIITLNMLNLENVSSIYFLKIYHIPNINVKIHFLQTQINLICDFILPQNINLLQLKYTLSNLDYALIYDANATELADYAKKLVNEAVITKQIDPEINSNLTLRSKITNIFLSGIVTTFFYFYFR